MVTASARGSRLGFALALGLAIGCGAALPELQGGVYRNGPIAFRIGAAPASWREIRVEGATLAYRDDADAASVVLDGRCYRKDDDVPLLALTEHLVMGTTDRQIGSQETIPFDGREALHTRLRAKLDGVPMDYDIFVLKKDGCVYDFVLVGEPGKTDAAVPQLERFVGTFHTLPGAGVGT